MIIYHLRPQQNRNFPDYGTAEEKIAFVRANRITGYTKVAELAITANRIEEAYRASQNGLDEQYPSWIDYANQYEGNRTYVPIETRSSMIGDIIRKDGKDFIVDNTGFLEL